MLLTYLVKIFFSWETKRLLDWCMEKIYLKWFLVSWWFSVKIVRQLLWCFLILILYCLRQCMKNLFLIKILLPPQRLMAEDFDCLFLCLCMMPGLKWISSMISHRAYLSSLSFVYENCYWYLYCPLSSIGPKKITDHKNNRPYPSSSGTGKNKLWHAHLLSSGKFSPFRCLCQTYWILSYS